MLSIDQGCSMGQNALGFAGDGEFLVGWHHQDPDGARADIKFIFGVARRVNLDEAEPGRLADEAAVNIFCLSLLVEKLCNIFVLA